MGYGYRKPGVLHNHDECFPSKHSNEDDEVEEKYIEDARHNEDAQRNMDETEVQEQ
jgi:hypothetical protein